ncbi:MAG: nucleoside hydrolase [Clostridiales bacterium]|nr:nucleoside hydrolase [Clostridiales bacterium]
MIRIPEHKKFRVILCSDAKNEADDQYALVHAILTSRFVIKGMIAGHFRERGTNKKSLEEMELLAWLTGTCGQYPIVLGADQKMECLEEPQLSPGASLIAEEAMKEDPRPLYVLNIGALTDLAAALLAYPQICSRLTAIWVGGGRYPEGSEECNLKNDLLAARAVFASGVRLWQIPSGAYKTTLVSVAELACRVAPMGPLGAYLYSQLEEFASKYIKEKPWINPECWVLGDSGAVGVLLDEQKGCYREIEAPDFDGQCRYLQVPGRKKIRVYDRLNNRMILEDLFAKLELFAKAPKTEKGEKKDG